MEVTLKIDHGGVRVYKDGKSFGVIGAGDVSNTYVQNGQIIIEKANGTYSAHDFNLQYLGGGGGSGKPIKSSSLYKPNIASKSDSVKNVIARFLVILAAVILLAISPGILVYDIFSDLPTNLGGKWWQAADFSNTSWCFYDNK